MSEGAGNFFVLAPEVPGGLGKGTIILTIDGKPVVQKLNYEFFGMPEDELIKSYPCFLFTERLASIIVAKSLTGICFEATQTSRSLEFDELHPNAQLPGFLWGKVSGVAGLNDFGVFKGRLIVSEVALSVLAPHCPDGMTRVEPWVACD